MESSRPERRLSGFPPGTARSPSSPPLGDVAEVMGLTTVQIGEDFATEYAPLMEPGDGDVKNGEVVDNDEGGSILSSAFNVANAIIGMNFNILIYICR
jgi:hypothetical protein